MQSKYDCEYRYSVRNGNVYHTWIVIGSKGALHLHITDLMGVARYSAGIEVHYRTLPDYMAHEPPSHKHCDILGAPCWHDGSSLAAEETWIPRWLAAPHDHDGMFAALREEADRTFLEEKP